MSRFTALEPAHRALAASMAALACVVVLGGELGLFAVGAPGASAPRASTLLVAKAPASTTQRPVPTHRA
jgi:hypothetical protein